MSIASRITSIEEHLTDDYNALEGIGADLTGVDKNIENIKNVLADIYDEMPKVSESDVESASLSPTRKGAMAIKYKGETQQDSTTGINLIINDLERVKSYNTSGTWNNNVYTYSGMTFTYNDDKSITISGTNSSTSTRYFYLNNRDNLQTLIAGSYTRITYLKNQTLNSGVSLQTRKDNVAGTDIFGSGAINVRNATLSENTNIVIRLAISESATVNITVYPMIVSGTYTSETIPDYEPYTNGASPNPDYPQEIHNVSGDNTIEICGKNMFNKDNPRIVNRLPADGGTITTGSNYISSYLPAKEGDIFTLSSTSNLLDTYASIFFVSEELSTATTWLARTQRSGGATSITATAPQNTKYVCFYMIFSNNQTTINSLLETIQIEKSSTATEYEAYTGQSQLISLGVENLFDINTNSLENRSSTRVGTTGYISLKAGTYTLSYMGADKSYYIYYDSNNTKIGESSWVNGTCTFTLSNDYKLVFIFGKTGDTNISTSDMSNIQLEKGTKANSYSEYGKPYIELNKISTYQDYIYKDNDIWYLHKEIGKVVLDGTENWNNDSGTQGTDYRHNINLTRLNIPTPININKTYISNYFTSRNIASDVGELGTFYLSNIWLVFVDKNKVYDLDQWKNWLSTYNPEIYYVLATPTDTEITDTTLLEQLETIKRSYDGVTNISQENNDLAFILDVSALKEWNNE